MSTEIKIEQDADCGSHQCTSEIKLESDVIKIEVDFHCGCEEYVEPLQINADLEHVQRGMSSYKDRTSYLKFNTSYPLDKYILFKQVNVVLNSINLA